MGWRIGGSDGMDEGLWTNDERTACAWVETLLPPPGHPSPHPLTNNETHRKESNAQSTAPHTESTHSWLFGHEIGRSRIFCLGFASLLGEPSDDEPLPLHQARKALHHHEPNKKHTTKVGRRRGRRRGGIWGEGQHGVESPFYGGHQRPRGSRK